MDQGSNKNHSPAYNFTPTVTKFCVMWEGLSLPHDTKFGNCRCKIVDSRSFHSWSLIHGLRWSGLIKVGPGDTYASWTWVIIGSGNGFSLVWCQAIAWSNADSLSVRTIGINFSENLIKVQTFLCYKKHLIMLSVNVSHFVLASMC